MDYIIPEIKKADKTLEVKIYPGKNHGFYWGTRVDSEFVDGMVQDIRAFSEGYLKTKPEAIDTKLYSEK